MTQNNCAEFFFKSISGCVVGPRHYEKVIMCSEEQKAEKLQGGVNAPSFSLHKGVPI